MFNSSPYIILGIIVLIFVRIPISQEDIVVYNDLDPYGLKI